MSRSKGSKSTPAESASTAISGAVAIFDFDFSTQRTEWSSEYWSITGLPPGHPPLSQAAWMKAVHPADRPRVKRAYAEHVKARRPEIVLDYRFRRRDGEIRLLQVRGMTAYDSTGRPVRMRGAVIDVTGHAQTEDALAANERRFQALLRQCVGGVTVLDQTGNVAYDVETAETRLGFTPNELCGMNAFGLIHPDDRERVEALVRALVAGKGKPKTLDVRVRAKDGSFRVLNVTGTNRLHDPDIRGIVINSFDITERKEAEALAEAQRAKLELLFNSMTEGFAHYEAIRNKRGVIVDLRVLEINPAGAILSGIKRKDQIGKTWRQVWPAVPEDAFEHYRKADRAGTALSLEHCSPITGRWYVSNISKIGQERFVVMFSDITDRKQAEEALRKSEQRFRIVFWHAVDGILVTGPDGRIIMANEAFARMHGYTHDEMVHMDLRTLDTPDSARLAPERFRRLLAGEEMTFEVEHFRKDGSTIPLEVSATKADIGDEVYLFGFHRDITYRKRIEEALRKDRDELERRVKERTAKLRALTIQLNQAEEHEQHRIAKILHDDLQQVITASRLTLSLLKEAPAGRKDSLNLVKTVDGYLERAHEVMRSLCMDLHPPVLHEVGLCAALRWLQADVAEKFHLKLKLAVDEAAEPTRTSVRSFLFQAARELLFNVVKHAGVKSAQITLKPSGEDSLMLKVKDCGAGFDPGQIKPTGFGLFSIRERVDFLGGKVEIESAPRAGTCVTLTLPRI